MVVKWKRLFLVEIESRRVGPHRFFHTKDQTEPHQAVLKELKELIVLFSGNPTRGSKDDFY